MGVMGLACGIMCRSFHMSPVEAVLTTLTTAAAIFAWLLTQCPKQRRRYVAIRILAILVTFLVFSLAGYAIYPALNTRSHKADPVAGRPVLSNSKEPPSQHHAMKGANTAQQNPFCCVLKESAAAVVRVREVVDQPDHCGQRRHSGCPEDHPGHQTIFDHLLSGQGLCHHSEKWQDDPHQATHDPAPEERLLRTSPLLPCGPHQSINDRGPKVLGWGCAWDDNRRTPGAGFIGQLCPLPQGIAVAPKRDHKAADTENNRQRRKNQETVRHDQLQKGFAPKGWK